MAIKFITTVLTLLCLKTTYAYNSGAPVQACDTMLPGHTQSDGTTPIQPQGGTSPFVINAQKTGSEGEVSVQITSSSQRPFKGFFLKAFRPGLEGDVTHIGEFVNFYDFANKVECPEEQALTHWNSQPKTNLEFTWKAKENGSVRFKATIVEAYDTFYTNVLSPEIKL